MFDNIRINLLGAYKTERFHVSAENKNRLIHALAIRLDGETTFEYQNTKTVVKSGDIVYLPAGFDYKCVSEYEKLIAVHFEASGFLSKKMIVFSPVEKKVYENIFENILSSLMEIKTGGKHEATAQLYSMFALMEKEQVCSLHIDEKIKSAIEYMNHHFNDPDLSVSDLAARAGVSEVYFRYIFEHIYKTSPLKFITQLRIDHAKKLLSTTMYSVSQASELSGFLDAKYFSQKFKAYTGMSPSKYKKIFS